MLIKRVSFSDFLEEFKKYGREDNFSYEGKKALFEYLNQISDDLGEPIELDVYNHVQEALHVAKNNNPVILKKIKEVPAQSWYYSRYLILSMQDYYDYKKGVYPFNEYHNVLKN